MSRSDVSSTTSTTSTGEQGIAPAQAESRQAALDPELKRLVNLVFARFAAIYGHKFESMFSGQQSVALAKREWALSLRGIAEAELVAAIDCCKERLNWMPTIAEFLAIVQELRGQVLPEVQQAYLEACEYADHPREHQWSHPLVYHAGRASDWYRLRREDARAMFKIFSQHYQHLSERWHQGERFQVPAPLQLPDKTPDHRFAFIENWGKQQGLAPEQAHTLLFYLSKQPGSPIYQQLYRRAEQLLQQWQRTDIILPTKVPAV